MNTAEATLLNVIMVMALTFGVSWMVIGRQIRLAPRAIVRFGLANGVLAAGVWLAVHRGAENSFLHYQISDWTLLLAFVGYRDGISYLLHKQHATVIQRMAPLLLSMAATAGVPPGPGSAHILALAFLLPGAWLALGAFRECERGLMAEGFSLPVRMALGWPFLLVGMVFGARLLQISLSAPEEHLAGTQDAGNLAFLWAMMVMMLVSNLSFAGMAGLHMLARIRELADRDHLTGTWNRRTLEFRLRIEYERNRRSGQHLSCVLLDLDHFKRINDTYGHAAGDAVLQHVVAVTGQGLRKQDVLGRYGGEEFLVILPDTHLSGARELASKVCQALRAHPMAYGDRSIAVTASLGAATLGSTESLESLIRRADAAMYKAKQNGRDRVEVAAETRE